MSFTTTTTALVHELMEARDERRLLNLLIIDELGFVPLSHTGAKLLFEVFGQLYARGSILVTTKLPFDEWTEVVWLGASYRGAVEPAHPPRVHPGDERRELPFQGQSTHCRRAVSGRVADADLTPSGGWYILTPSLIAFLV